MQQSKSCQLSLLLVAITGCGAASLLTACLVLALFGPLQAAPAPASALSFSVDPVLPTPAVRVSGLATYKQSTPLPLKLSAALPLSANTPLCRDAQPPFVTDQQVRQALAVAEPAPRVTFRDPVFGSCIVRVTDHLTDFPVNKVRGLKNEYSRVQSFNADGSRLLVRGTDATWYLYDAATLQPLRELPIDMDPRWDARDPKKLYYARFADEDKTASLMALDVETGTATVEHDFGPDFPGEKMLAVWTKSEGTPSSDGRYWGMMAQDQEWNTAAFLVYDQQEHRVVAKRDMRGVAGAEMVDNTTMSLRGAYFIADYADHYCERGTLGTDARPCGIMVYDREIKNGRGVLRTMGHADTAIDAQGREVLVFQDVDTDDLSMIDLATGTVTPLWPIDFTHTSLGMHISGRAIARPGWVVVSTYSGGHPTSFTWMDNQVFLVELKEGGRVVRLAHTRSLWKEGEVAYGEKDYWAEPHASPNQDLTRIVFTSNWERTGTEEVDLYMLELPANWEKQLP